MPEVIAINIFRYTENRRIQQRGVSQRDTEDNAMNIDVNLY